jgi:NAD(P)-dependent dehydrogenase (short-subunit alcohol dehydrogenase family)
VIGVLVNAAGTDAPGPAEDVTLEDWDRVIAVNPTAPFALARAVMSHMPSEGGGLIVNASSVAGRRGWANASAYCSTKFALTGLAQSLAAEGRADRIRVCVLYPGAMTTNWGTFDPTERPEPVEGTATRSRASTPARWLTSSPDGDSARAAGAQ